MSHLITLRRSETPSEATEEGIQDSPTIGRGTSGCHSDRPPSSASSSSSSSTTITTTTTLTTTQTTAVAPLSLPFTSIAKSQRKAAAPSPLHISSSRSSPSLSPKSTGFPSPAVDRLGPSPLPSPSASASASASASTEAATQPLTNTHRLSQLPNYDLEDTSFLEISPPVTPVTSDPRPKLPPILSNESPSVLSPVARTKPAGPATRSLNNMASRSSITRADAVRAPARTSSIDSAVSAISSRAPSQQSSPDDVANLIRAAGSPEAVIQYLLKEKQSQSQQNAQLWRLVDKQRAMILGLNKDLDRAMKDKDRYRKKLKEVVAIHDDYAKPDIASRTGSLATIDTKVSDTEHSDTPRSPSNLESDGSKQSALNVTLASYPITPPADPIPGEPLANIRGILKSAHTMPISAAHAQDRFDHEERDRVANEERNATNVAQEFPIHIGPPSRSPPSEPLRVSPPEPPTVSIIEATPIVDQGMSQFPPLSAPPLRKPPPAPLQLRKELNINNSPAIAEEIDSESDYDSLLEVDELPTNQPRGRRRTREDDDREREIIAQREAEARSLSKKSKKGSQKGISRSDNTQNIESGVPINPRPEVAQLPTMRDNIPASLAGMLSGNAPQKKLHPALMSPGLPSSPRPTTFPQPLTPRNMTSAAGPLSPRAPRQPLPLPPITPKFQPMSIHPSSVAYSKPYPVKHTQELESFSELEQPERTEIYRGLVTEEYPDLLLPPNALPSVAVKVASSRMKPSRASLLALTQLEEDPVFTLAIISRSEGGELWRVEKDTSSLAKLDQRMKQCSSFTSKTPDRSLFSGHAPAKLDARRTALDNYLDELLNTALDLPTAVELCRYLSTSVLPPNSDDTSHPSEENGETAPPRRGPGGRPFKNGYLTKRGKNFGGWKARFFVLDSPNLRYYEAPGGAHLGTIKLQNAQIGKQSQQTTDGSNAGGSNGDESDNQYRHAFLVLEPKKKDTTSYVRHVLCAESDQERDQWVDALLRWIDYRDPNVDKTALKPGAQGHSNQGHGTGANTKKKTHGQGKLYDQQGESQDTLVGMSYDATKQGDIPDGAPPQRRGTASPEPAEKGPSAYMISAPKDPYIISDSASWGSKTSLLPLAPSVEEKKQRKRSFFGFGPKARSSSDDQDPLSNSSGGSTPQPQSELRGPVRQVFGAPLAEAVRYCGPTDSHVPIPAVVYRCIQYLDMKNAVEEEGLFRVSGSNAVIKQLRERFNVEGDVHLVADDTLDIHAVASLLKLYLRELPTTILTRELHNQFVTVTEIPNLREKIEALAELVQRLPLANETLLKYLISFLIKVINNADMNKMTVRNVGIVFSPTLHIPAPVFALLLQNYRGIFGIEPEEYELPSPVSEADSRPPSELPPRRPSTAGATESPHRQRLIEQMYQRSSPTPPPTAPGLGIRATGTPPPRQAHEAQYFAQQGSSLQPNPRPGHEGGFASPNNYDLTAAATPSSKQPAYDRPHYGYGSSYEQGYTSDSNGMLDASFGNKSKKRESAMFMGNIMHHQTSNSRLREETRL